MTFRRDTLLFYQHGIICAAMAVLSLSLIPPLGLELSLLCALVFIVLAVLNPRIHNEFITINEQGILCHRAGEQLWAYKWDEIVALKRSSRFRLPSVDVIVYNKYGEAECFSHSDCYFQLGKLSKKAIDKYYPRDNSTRDGVV